MTHQLEYSALQEPVTKTDITAYKESGLYKGFQIGNVVAGIVVIALIAVLIPFVIDTFRSSGLSINLLTPIVVIGAFIVILWQMFANATTRRAKLYKFARRNNLTFLVDVSDPGYAGMIFDNGHSRQIDDAIKFNDDTEIGNYTYVTGSGKSQKTHRWAYAKVKLVRRLPHMVLDAKSNNFWKFSSLSNAFDRSQTLALEGDFNNYFTLYAPRQYERDALYVFTPDVMSAMVDHGKEYDIEIVDDELFIYTNGYFELDKPEVYDRLLTIMNTITSELIDQTDYYSDERIGDRNANIVAPEGKRLKFSTNWLVIIFLLIYIYFLAIQPIIMRIMDY